MKKINLSEGIPVTEEVRAGVDMIRKTYGSQPDKDRRPELALLCGEYSQLLQAKMAIIEGFEKFEEPLPPPMPCRSFRLLDVAESDHVILVGYFSNILEPGQVFPGSLFVKDGSKLIGLYCPSVTRNGVTSPALAETQVVERYLPSLLRSIAYTKERLKDAV